MRQTIKEYIEPKKEEKSKIWTKSVFVFDTNVLLNLYRYSKKTQDALLKAIDGHKTKIWMPYQVAREFMKNRYEVIFDASNRYQKIKNECEKFIKTCKDNLRKDETDEGIEKLSSTLKDWIAEEEQKDSIIESPLEDHILDQILVLFDKRVGKPYSEEEIKNIQAEGSERYKKGFPPGYKDENKKENEYGDLIIWKQIIDYSKTQKRDIVFVLNDVKEDWWNRVNGKTIGPRPELRKEFEEQTGQRILFYTMSSFLTYCNEENSRETESTILDEVIKIERKKNLHKTKIPKENIPVEISRIEKRIQKKKERMAVIADIPECKSELISLQQGMNVLNKRLDVLRTKL